MTKEETTTKAKKSGRQHGKQNNKDKNKAQTKIVIRHLPPTMTEEEFLEQFDPLPNHDHYYFTTPDWSLGCDATCRAYINFKSYDDIFLFRDRFDGYVCVDSKGNEYTAIVEFAPFQGFAKNKSRNNDNKVNTIELESHYQQFIAKLEEDREAIIRGTDNKMDFSLDRKKEEKITSTPLLQYLANKKEKRREEAKKRTEEKRRQREEDKKQQQSSVQLQSKAEKQAHDNKLYNIGTWQDSAEAGKNKKDGSGGAGKEASKKQKDANATTDASQDAAKLSRSKRRTERNQRRHEAYMQRKIERERDGSGSQKESAKSSSTMQLKKSDSQSENAGILESDSITVLRDEGKATTTSDDKKRIQGESGKRYSEKRERNRNRRDRDKEKDKEKDKDKDKDKDKQKASNSGSGKNQSLSKDDNQEINPSVMSFIRIAASTKPTKSKEKRLSDDGKDAASSENCNEENETVSEKQTKSKEKRADSEDDNASRNDEKTIVETESSSTPTVKAEKQLMTTDPTTEERPARNETTEMTPSQRAEERRIRNKDRPSIAIYQPKARLRASEESDNGLPSGATKEKRNSIESDDK